MGDDGMWNWEQPDPDRGGAAGDVAKLFRNQAVKRPGVFSIEPPSSSASLLARETIQNAWDSAHEYRKRTGDLETEFEITFDFQEHVGDRKRDLVKATGLGELAARAGVGSAKRRELGLLSTDALSDLDDDDIPLRTLSITEEGTTGLDGPWKGQQSKMYLALLGVGFTRKGEGSGGSFGYGKAALVGASATRTVMAYSSFGRRRDDKGVTRRFLGVTYFGPHDHEDQAFTGFGRLTDPAKPRSASPAVNEAADDLAESMGVDSRSADAPGTTFLLIDPTVEPTDLVRAIERNWWPALVSRQLQFTARVIDYDGRPLTPRPMKDPTLRPFTRAFDIASGKQDSLGPQERHHKFDALDGLAVGQLGLVADLDGWSFADRIEALDPTAQRTDTGHRSLIALVRGPRMVVEYLDAGRTAPYIRGTFVAHSDVDDLLRRTEPPAHDCWLTSLDGGDEQPATVARSVTNRIQRRVREMAKALKPPAPPPDEVRLDLLDELVKGLVKGSGSSTRPAPKAEKRDVSIRFLEQRLEPATTGEVRFRAKVRLELSDHLDDDRREVQVNIHYKFVEDGGAGELCAFESLAIPDGFGIDEDNVLSGGLGHEPVDISIVTAPYSEDWTGRLIAHASVLRKAAIHGQ